MPADERIKVIFKKVTVTNDSDFWGSGEFYFAAKVDGMSVGNPNRIFNAVEGRDINLPAAQWSQVVNVRGDNRVMVEFKGMDEEVFGDEFLGRIRHRLSRPFRQRTLHHHTRFFTLEWVVELAAGGSFGRHPPNAVFATRQNTGSITVTTVSGTHFPARMEIHPVRPTPAGPAATALPARPRFTAVTPSHQNTGRTPVLATSAMNVLPNPTVIPVLSPPAAASVGPHRNSDLDDAFWANARNCARIEYSEYWPATLNFRANSNDPRLEWTVRQIGGAGAVAFLGPARGPMVNVYGTQAGEVVLEVRYKGALLASYRALVLQVKQVPCRFTIWNGTARGTQPRSRPQDVLNHLAIANRYLRQLGLSLVLDTTGPRHGAVVVRLGGTIQPGIFRRSCPPRQTFRIPNTGFAFATRRNFRNNVMNFAYIHSERVSTPGFVTLGAADDYPANGAASPFRETGSPSSSWTRNTGVGIGADATAGPVSMTLIPARQRARPALPNLVSMYVTNACGSPTTAVGQETYGATIAHEFGHNLNLGHRGSLTDGFTDGLAHPTQANVMAPVSSPRSQDFDIVQARAVHQSPVVTGAPVLAAPPPGPRPPRVGGGSTEYTIVSGDTLSRIAQRYGMTWRQLWDYDGGTGRANKSRLRSADPDLIYPNEVLVVPDGA